MTYMTDAPAPTGLVFKGAAGCMTCTQAQAFAIVELGQKRYRVADRLDGQTGLAFCDDTGGPWYLLDAVIADGWARIGAQILMTDPDVMRHFLLTHAVRVKGWYRLGERITFETFGITWSVALVAHDRALVTLADRPAVGVDPVHAKSADLREQAIELLLHADPDLEQVFGPHIAHWAYRIATGLRILPVM